MNLKKLICLAGIALVAMAAAGMDEKTARAELKVLEMKAKKAMESENHAVLCGMLADNFVWKHMGGMPNETKKQACDGLKQFFAMGDHFNVSWTHKSFTFKGNTATMVTSEVMTCTVVMPNDKKKHHMKSTGTMRETWVKGANGWKATMFEELTVGKYWMDGKPFDPMKAGGGK